MNVSARNELWRRGELSWSLLPIQRRIYDLVQGKRFRRVTAAVHRRCGKSHLAVTMLVEICLRKPGAVTVYIGPTKLQIGEITGPLFRKVLATCPDHLRPKQRGDTYEFPNGSVIYLAGADSRQMDRRRGTDVDGAVLDEVGQFDDPEYLVKDVLNASVITSGGFILEISTPPKSPSHPFGRRMLEAEKEGSLVVFDVDQNPYLTPELIAEYEKESGGRHTSTFQREYMCKLVTDDRYAVVPESKRLQTGIIWETPAICYTAVSLDPAGLSFAVYLAYHPRENVLAVTGERMIPSSDLESIAKHILSGEEKSYLRVRYTSCSDEMGKLLASQYGYSSAFFPDWDLDAGLASLRSRIIHGQLVVSPDCTETVRHLKDAVWTETRTKMDVSGDGGRFDGVTALGLFSLMFRSTTGTPDGSLRSMAGRAFLGAKR